MNLNKITMTFHRNIMTIIVNQMNESQSNFEFECNLIRRLSKFT